MANQTENQIERHFQTKLPLDVFKDLLAFAKKESGTAMGQFDFGVALRLLLRRYKDNQEILNSIEELKQLINNKGGK